MTDHTTGTEIALVERDGEPRAHDLDVGKRLGFARPRKVRDLIKANEKELLAFGSLAPQRGKSRGQEFDAYFLNEEQALLVATLSEAPKAPAVRAMLIRTFVAWRRGHLLPQAIDHGKIGRQVAAIVQDKLAEAVENMLPAMIEERLLADPRRAALDLVSVRQMLNDGKALSKGRRGLNRKVGAALKGGAMLAASRGEPMPARKCPHTGVWLYKKDYADDFMRQRGNALVAEHNAVVTGQGVIPFPTRRPSDPALPPSA